MLYVVFCGVLNETVNYYFLQAHLFVLYDVLPEHF